MKLSKGKISRILKKKNQSRKKYNKKFSYHKKTFRKKKHLNLNNKSHKNLPIYRGGNNNKSKSNTANTKPNTGIEMKDMSSSLPTTIKPKTMDEIGKDAENANKTNYTVKAKTMAEIDEDKKNLDKQSEIEMKDLSSTKPSEEIMTDPKEVEGKDKPSKEIMGDPKEVEGKDKPSKEKTAEDNSDDEKSIITDNGDEENSSEPSITIQPNKEPQESERSITEPQESERSITVQPTNEPQESEPSIKVQPTNEPQESEPSNNKNISQAVETVINYMAEKIGSKINNVNRMGSKSYTQNGYKAVNKSSRSLVENTSDSKDEKDDLIPKTNETTTDSENPEEKPTETDLDTSKGGYKKKTYRKKRKIHKKTRRY